MLNKSAMAALPAFALIFAGCRAGAGDLSPVAPTIYLVTAALPSTLTPRPTDTSAPPTAVPTIAPVEGTTTSQVNVRAEPAAAAEMLGSLGIFAKVQVIGTDASKSWYRIIYAAASGGKGWVSAAYVQVPSNANLPVIGGTPDILPSETAATRVLGTIAPSTPITTAPISTFTPAREDGDSAASPAVSVTFSPSTAQSFQYTSDVSEPEGDAEDWVQFTPYGGAGKPSTVSVTVDCTGSDTLTVELWQRGVPLQTWQDLTCGARRRLILSLFGGAPYELRVRPGSENTGLQYNLYTLLVQATDP